VALLLDQCRFSSAAEGYTAPNVVPACGLGWAHPVVFACRCQAQRPPVNGVTKLDVSLPTPVPFLSVGHSIQTDPSEWGAQSQSFPQTPYQALHIFVVLPLSNANHSDDLSRHHSLLQVRPRQGEPCHTVTGERTLYSPHPQPSMSLDPLSENEEHQDTNLHQTAGRNANTHTGLCGSVDGDIDMANPSPRHTAPPAS
jgi:hypothetical protein